MRVLESIPAVSHQLPPAHWESVISLIITLSSESPRILAEMERNVEHSRLATPALSILLNAVFVFHSILSKPKTLERLKEGEEWPRRGCGSSAAADTDVYPIS